jgi:hypothetical protein
VPRRFAGDDLLNTFANILKNSSKYIYFFIQFFFCFGF